MIDLIYLTRFRTEIWLRDIERRAFQIPGAARFVPYVLPVVDWDAARPFAIAPRS